MKSLRMSGWRWIIGVALLAALLGGCSLLRIGYAQAPHLLYWRIDGYLDLNDAQGAKLHDDIARWFEWHRRAELPRYAALLARAQREIVEPTLTTAQMCFWRDEAQRRLDAAVEPAAPALGALLVSLAPSQIRHMERQLAKDGEELERDFAQPDAAERARASLKRTQGRYETLYGKLDDSQRAKLAELLAASPFDAGRWLAEREARNRDLVATIASVAGRPADAAQAQAAVKLLAERALRSPRPDYRAYQERLAQANCALAATMHNVMTPAQREHARAKLKGWEDDVRLLAADGNGSTAESNGRASR